MIDVAISTVERPKQYIYGLMSRLRKNLPIRLIVGSPTYSYLTRYRGRKTVEIIGVDLQEWEKFKNRPVAHKASWNYWRCFTYGARSPHSKGLLILEDDVLPAKDWEKKMQGIIQQIELQYGDQYVLSLYMAYPNLAEHSGSTVGYQPYIAFTFRNTQAMYYPEPIRSAFKEYIRREGVEKFRKHYDQLLSEYLTQTGIPLFVSTPCLFQHIGKVTTGLSKSFHTTPNFRKR